MAWSELWARLLRWMLLRKTGTSLFGIWDLECLSRQRAHDAIPSRIYVERLLERNPTVWVFSIHRQRVALLLLRRLLWHLFGKSLRFDPELCAGALHQKRRKKPRVPSRVSLFDFCGLSNGKLQPAWRAVLPHLQCQPRPQESRNRMFSLLLRDCVVIRCCMWTGAFPFLTKWDDWEGKGKTDKKIHEGLLWVKKRIWE